MKQGIDLQVVMEEEYVQLMVHFQENHQFALVSHENITALIR